LKKCFFARHVRLSVWPSVCPWLHVFVDEKMRSLSFTAVSTELYYFSYCSRFLLDASYVDLRVKNWKFRFFLFLCSS
jgi:hypothetical protein